MPKTLMFSLVAEPSSERRAARGETWSGGEADARTRAEGVGEPVRVHDEGEGARSERGDSGDVMAMWVVVLDG